VSCHVIESALSCGACRVCVFAICVLVENAVCALVIVLKACALFCFIAGVVCCGVDVVCAGV
jgi:hypothetical protein